MPLGRALATCAGMVARHGLESAPGTPEIGANLIDAFRQGLQELGYIEGQNIRIDVRWQPVERPDVLSEIISELVRSKSDVLVGPTTRQALALKQATTTIPIVMVVPSDPVGTGLVASLAQPGGNVTGLAWMSNDIIRKRLELLKETLPKTSRVTDLWNPSDPATLRLRCFGLASTAAWISLRRTRCRGLHVLPRVQSVRVLRCHSRQSSFSPDLSGFATRRVTLGWTGTGLTLKSGLTFSRCALAAKAWLSTVLNWTAG